MNKYIKWSEKILSNFTEEEIENSYNEGFVFTRKYKGSMDQTRSLRIDLDDFEPSSENRRILRKNEHLKLSTRELPMNNYSFEIHKIGKVFYEKKFGKGVMSANKIKEMLTSPYKSNFNTLFVFEIDSEEVGYCIAVQTLRTIHYSYPFYRLEYDSSSLGIGMMTMAVNWAKENSKKYIYLGSYRDSSSKYKIQFKGVEWFDGKEWSKNLEKLKNL